ncbi:MAG: FixH family protein [Burkholderiaceae bacterium]|jgi:hypothetical protein|nr:FixH family protein [Burkholderiaceae bacterium]MDP3133988.1 FixH family protein [Burkholderiaceae bacterium]MDP3423440.1 FixH family protein [Burkholderiaceae bacterium]MDZ4160772.1 FixH family protein [Burkholderiales bacterium]
MNATTLSSDAVVRSRPGWQEPYFWLVIGGPLVVVVAAIITAVIAFKNADPVIDKNAYQQELLKKRHLESTQILEDLAKLQPAHQARNNAAAPVIPALNDVAK